MTVKMYFILFGKRGFLAGVRQANAKVQGGPWGNRLQLPGITFPSTTARRAPVAPTTFDGSPRRVARARMAKASASLVSLVIPNSSIRQSCAGAMRDQGS